MAARLSEIGNKNKQRISKNWEFIQNNFDANGETLDKMIGDLVMETSVQQRILSINPDTAKNRNCAFFDWLFFESSPEAYDSFLSALNSSGWKQVADKIKDTIIEENDPMIDPMKDCDAFGHRGSHTSEKLKELLGEADLQLRAYGKYEGTVFVPSPAFKACQQKLEKGRVTIVGASGDGKTTIAMELLRQTKRRAVIIADNDDWKNVNLVQDQNLIILFDDMLGKFVLDLKMKTYWGKQLDKIFAGVRSGKIQVVITCRETVLSQCRADIEHYQLFRSENRVHLSGPDSTLDSRLDTNTKRKMINKYINSNFAESISKCDKLDQEILSGDVRKISLMSLEKIAHKTCPGFPQCCFTFVSMPACFARGDTFFDNPTEFLIQELNRMCTSHDDIDKFNYCTLVCVLIYEKLNYDIIKKEIETIKLIANTCRINVITTTIPAEIQLAATRLSSSYLIDTHDTGYVFQHNSLVETIFMSFFKSEPALLIEHCNFNLIHNLITTELAKEKSGLFCQIHGDEQTNSLCSRLATEIMASHIEQVVQHRALTDHVFACMFCSYIETSYNKITILQSSERGWGVDKTILFWAATVSDEYFVEPLLAVMESTISVLAMKKEMSTALVQACRKGNYGVYSLLVSRLGATVYSGWKCLICCCFYDVDNLSRSTVTVNDECLVAAAIGGDSRIVAHLLSSREWPRHDVSRALYQACEYGNYEVYKLLVSRPGVRVCDRHLKWATLGGDIRIVTHMLSAKKWRVWEMGQILHEACVGGKYELYTLVVSHDVTVLDGKSLWLAVVGEDIRILTDMLYARKWPRRAVSECLYWACRWGKYEAYTLLVAHDVMAVDDKCLLRAALGGDSRIVTHLLSAMEWIIGDVSEALYWACYWGKYEVYTSLVTHDITAVDTRCLIAAATGGNTQIINDMRTKGYTLPDDHQTSQFVS